MRRLRALLLVVPPVITALAPASGSQEAGREPDVSELLAQVRERGDLVDPDVIRALARRGDEDGLEGLLTAYERMRSVYMRRHVLRRLPRFQAEPRLAVRAMAQLEEVATSSSERELRLEAVELLGAFGGAAREVLGRLVEAPVDPAVRDVALELVAGLGREDDVPWLRELFGIDGPEEGAAGSPVPGSLRRLAFDALRSTLSAEELRAALEDPVHEIACAALGELDTRDDEQVLELAEGFYESVWRSGRRRGGPPDVRRAIAGAQVLARRLGVDAARRFLEDGGRADTPLAVAEALAELLSGMDDPAVEKLLAKKVGKGRGQEKLFQLLAGRRLEGERYDKAFTRALEDGDPTVRGVAREICVARGLREVADDLEEALEDVENPLERAEILRALAGLGATGEDWTSTLLREAGHAEPFVRNTALELLAGRLDPALVPTLAAALESDDWSTRLVAARGLARFRIPEVVGLLVDRIALEQGRMRHELAELLFRLTAQPFETASGSWRAWWDAEGDSFRFPDEAELAQAEREREERFLKQISKSTQEVPEELVAERPRYYGIEIVSSSVMFVLDVSGSMDDALEGTGERRIAVARRRLLAALDGLPPTASFNVLLFEGSIHRWREEPGSRSVPEDVEQVKAFVQDTDPGGGTNIHGALAEAFRTSDVDTVYLLSDGEPSVGVVEPGEILRDLRRWHTGLAVTVHCIALGEELPLLRGIAEETGGEYVSL